MARTSSKSIQARIDSINRYYMRLKSKKLVLDQSYGNYRVNIQSFTKKKIKGKSVLSPTGGQSNVAGQRTSGKETMIWLDGFQRALENKRWFKQTG